MKESLDKIEELAHRIAGDDGSWRKGVPEIKDLCGDILHEVQWLRESLAVE